MPKVFLFGGKGGVGKTTLSSASALYLSEKGYRTLLISTDPAHSLSDVLRTEVGSQPTEIQNNLYALEIDPSQVLEEYTERAVRIAERIAGPDTYRHFKEMIESIVEAPGSAESALLDRLAQVITELWNRWDAFVVDTAPTGHTLQMLKTVGRVGNWLEDLIKRRKEANRLRNMAGEDREDEVLEILSERRKRLSAFSRIALSEETLFTPVMIAQRLSIEETHRLVKNLSLWKINTGKIAVNKTLPEDTKDPFMLKRKEQERIYMEEIESRFGKERIIKVPLFERDIVGINALKKLKPFVEELIG